MNLINKFVIGLAKSDPKYGINKINNFSYVFDLAPITQRDIKKNYID